MRVSTSRLPASRGWNDPHMVKTHYMGLRRSVYYTPSGRPGSHSTRPAPTDSKPPGVRRFSSPQAGSSLRQEFWYTYNSRAFVTQRGCLSSAVVLRVAALCSAPPRCVAGEPLTRAQELSAAI